MSGICSRHQGYEPGCSICQRDQDARYRRLAQLLPGAELLKHTDICPVGPRWIASVFVENHPCECEGVVPPKAEWLGRLVRAVKLSPRGLPVPLWWLDPDPESALVAALLAALEAQE